MGTNADGVESFIETYHTPKGDLQVKGARNQFTSWETEHMIKTEKDFELFREFYPVPIKADWTRVIRAKDAVGDRGIVRTWCRNYGQPGIWQSFTYLVGTENAILQTYDDPDWVHYALGVILDKSLRTIENMGKIEADLVENGGGSASSTVISPAIHREFCLPYDKKQHEAIHRQGALVVYHLCGGLMPLLETVTENGLDALETMTPASMGGDCRMEEAARRIGDRIAFIGGFDQNEGFERGNREFIRKEVQRLFQAKPNGGYLQSFRPFLFRRSREPEIFRAGVPRMHLLRKNCAELMLRPPERICVPAALYRSMERKEHSFKKIFLGRFLFVFCRILCYNEIVSAASAAKNGAN